MASETFDVVVIGEGLAGATASLAATQAGARVALITKAAGSFVLGDGCIGVAKETFSRLETPAETCEEAFRFFRDSTAAAGCEYRGDLRESFLIPTILGNLLQVNLAPLYFGVTDTLTRKRILIAGLKGILDFDARFVGERLAVSLNRHGANSVWDARTLEVDGSDGVFSHPLHLASQFDRSADFRERVIRTLAGAAKGADLVILPGILGLNTSTQQLAEIASRIGADICETATVPPCVPGLRLFRRLERHLLQVGVEICSGFAVHELVYDNGICRGAVVATPGRPRRIYADTTIVATGAFSHLVDAEFRSAIQTPRPGLLLCGGALRCSDVRTENAVAVVTGFVAAQIASGKGVQHAAR